MEQKDRLAIQRLQDLVRATCLRRTKQKTLSSGKLELPQRSERIQKVCLHPEDQALYDLIKRAAQEKAAKLDSQPRMGLLSKDREKNIIVLLNCLRLICNHGQQLLPESLKKMIEKASSATDLQQHQIYARECSVCGGELENSSSVKNLLCANCATSEEGSSTPCMQINHANRETGSGLQSAMLGKSKSAKLIHRPSAKILALLENLHRDKSTSVSSCKHRKRYVEMCLFSFGNPRFRLTLCSVVFSYWVGMLDLIEQALDREGICFQRIDGQTSLEGRRKAVLEFNGLPDCTVMLASIGSAAEGYGLLVTCDGLSHDSNRRHLATG